MVANALPAIASAIGTVASSFFGHKEAEDSSALQYAYQTKLNKQNYKYNVKLINKQNAFNEAMMDKANEYNLARWQEAMEQANTAHQREVADLRAAGLNPVLSANGGASTVNPIQSAQTSSGNSQLSSSAGLPDVDFLGAMQTGMNLRNAYKTTESTLKNDAVSRTSTLGHLSIDRNNSASQIALNDQKIAESKQNVSNQTRIANATVKKLEADAVNSLSNSARNHADIQRIKNEAQYTSTKNKTHTYSTGINLGKLGLFGITRTPNMPTLKVGNYKF